jgi:cell division protein FtsA
MPVRVADPADYYQMPPGRDGADFISAIGTIRYILSKERNPFKFMDEPLMSFGGLPSITSGPETKRESSLAWSHTRRFFEKLKESFKELF